MLIAIMIAASIIGYRIYRLASNVKLIGGFESLEIKLTNGFFIEQTVGLLFLSLFIVALDPIPSYFAIIILVSFFADTIFTLVYYSVKKTLSAAL
jgi:hypothetical protein